MKTLIFEKSHNEDVNDDDKFNLPQKYIIFITIICILSILPAIFLLYTTPKNRLLREPPTTKSSKSSYKPKSFKDVFFPLLKNRSLWLMPLLAFEIYGICLYFLSYAWQYYLKSYCTLSNDTYSSCLTKHEYINYAYTLALLFPFFGVFSSLFVGILKDSISTKHRCLIVSCFTGAFLILFISLHLTTIVVSASEYLWGFEVFFVCGCGLTILGPFSLLMGVFCVDIGGKYRSATVTGILDAFGMFFLLLFESFCFFLIFVFFLGFFSGVVVLASSYHENLSNYAIFWIIIFFTLAAIFTSLILWRFDIKKYSKSSKENYDDEDDHMYILDIGDFKSLKSYGSNGSFLSSVN